MPEEFTLFPAAKAILTIPFWLPAAPRPLPVEQRQEMLKQAAVALNSNKTGAVAGIRWEVLDLDWSREPQDVRPPKIWHPKPAVTRKGSILKGTLTDDEQAPTVLPTGEVRVAIVKRAILYYDYGVCSLEYVFEFCPSSPSATADWLTSSFWRHFREQIMDAVEHRRLGALRDDARWFDVQRGLVEALAAAAPPRPTDAASPLRRRAAACLARGRIRFGRAAAPLAQAGIVRFDRIFGLPAVKRGHLCASFGINFILFGRFGDEPPSSDSVGLKAIVERLLGGRPMRDADGGARSEHLAYVLCGAVHTLLILRDPPESKDAAGAVDAARALLRYLWMGYGILAEASRGLMALQGEHYLGYLPTLREEPRVRGIVKDLEVAGQIFDLLIAEFHFSMFWESAIEYDIYHPAYEQWRMPELARFVKENLDAAAKTAGVLRGGIEARRQRGISLMLGWLATLTIINAIANLFGFSRWEPNFLEIERWEPAFLHLKDTWRDTLTIAVLVICLMFIMRIYHLNRERRDRQ